MREVPDRQLWTCIVGKAAADSLAGVPLSRIERLGDPDLLALPGVGPRAARIARAVAEVARRAAAAPPPRGTLFQHGRDVARFYRHRLGDEDRELFYVLALDNGHRLLRESLVAIGGSNRVFVSPRDVFVPVVRERASSALVLHNHPSGRVEPSPEDVQLSMRLREAANILGVKLLDFVIVASDGYTSFADSGLFTNCTIAPAPPRSGR
jgi:DNA repair protein RadC